MLRVLIVDDEPLAREMLRSLLQEERDIEVVGECGNAIEGISAVHKLQEIVDHNDRHKIGELLREAHIFVQRHALFVAAEEDFPDHFDDEEFADQVSDHPGHYQQQQAEAGRQHAVSLNKTHQTLYVMHDNHVQKM